MPHHYAMQIFENANMYKAILNNAYLKQSNLKIANLGFAKIHGANLQEANLSEANLQFADLHDSHFVLANLQKAHLSYTKIINTNFWMTNFQDTIFESEPGTHPHIPMIAHAKNLFQLTYKESPHALIELRKSFKELGIRH